MVLRSCEDLDAWKAAHQMTLAVYRVTKMFPRDEQFGLTSQMRRAAVSIEANLAEGFGRRSPREMLRYARIADGSLQEVKCYIRLTRDLDYIDDEQHENLSQRAGRVGALLGGLQTHLGRRAADA